jgi:hypothetical protein
MTTNNLMMSRKRKGKQNLTKKVMAKRNKFVQKKKKYFVW